MNISRIQILWSGYGETVSWIFFSLSSICFQWYIHVKDDITSFEGYCTRPLLFQMLNALKNKTSIQFNFTESDKPKNGKFSP